MTLPFDRDDPLLSALIGADDAHAMTDASLKLTVSFGGGAEQLFDNKRTLDLLLPRTYADNRPVDLRHLIAHMRTLLHDPTKVDLFAQGETVRPGILILVNDVDWELEGELDYQLKDGDDILFISTLHGG